MCICGLGKVGTQSGGKEEVEYPVGLFAGGLAAIALIDAGGSSDRESPLFSGSNSLFSRFNSLFSPEKFPDPVRRELAA
jgi:hypothetical protein